MMDKADSILKLLPGFTLLCYFCGFVIFNTFLLEFGIVDASIINVRFIATGLLYLLIGPVVLYSSIFRKDPGIIDNAFVSLLWFTLYNSVFVGLDLKKDWPFFLGVFVINIASTIELNYFRNKKYFETFDITEAPIRLFITFLISLMLFALYFPRIRNNFGGGNLYRKVLILKERKDNLLKTDSLLHSDTLNIIYENDAFIYFVRDKFTVGIRKDIIEGEAMIRE